jgi:hypothetical protein
VFNKECTMQSFSVFLMTLILALAAFACSADVETETAGEVQDELACAYPTGSIGSATSGRVTQFLVSSPKQVTAKSSSGGWTTTKTFNWDPSSATTMTGGWAGTMIKKVTLEPCSYPGPVCMTMNKGLPDEASINFAAGGSGSPAPITSTFEMNEGVTKIEVVDSDSGLYRRFKFTGYHNGQQIVVLRTFPGSGGC